jgi:hypothetical protein
MDEVYIRTDDLAKFVKENYFDNKDFITLDEFYRAFEELSSDYDILKEKYEDLKNKDEE